MQRGAIILLALMAGVVAARSQDADTPPEAARPAAKPRPAPKKPVARPATAKPDATPAPPAELPPPVEPKPPLLHYCAPPVVPECTNAPETFANAKAKAACNQDMDRYIKFVFSYRLCLNLEMERAVRETNETIARHRCKLAGGKKC